jgi:photosystem II stability/assembly factor-like uncharacterized protein
MKLPALSIYTYFAISLVQLASMSACGKSSQPKQGAPPGTSQTSARVTKISSLPATDASYEIQFVSVNDCFLSMPNGLWRSIDGGRNWEMVHHATGYWDTVIRVRFFDTTRGWMQTHSGWLKSEDGGRTWQPFVTPLSSSGSLRDVKFISRDIGWIAGAALRVASPKELKVGIPRHLLDDITGKVLTPIIYRTDDGGKTWRVQNIPASLGNIEKIDFVDSDHGIAVGFAAFQTRDGGKTWHETKDPQTCDEDGEEGESEGDLWAYLLDSTYQWIVFDNGRMLRTTNGGQTWVELQPCDQTRPIVIYFSSQTHGYGLGSDGLLYETTDAGKQWLKIDAIKYHSLSFLDSRHVWLVSDQGLFRINDQP